MLYLSVSIVGCIENMIEILQTRINNTLPTESLVFRDSDSYSDITLGYIRILWKWPYRNMSVSFSHWCWRLHTYCWELSNILELGKRFHRKQNKFVCRLKGKYDLTYHYLFWKWLPGVIFFMKKFLKSLNKRVPVWEIQLPTVENNKKPRQLQQKYILEFYW